MFFPPRFELAVSQQNPDGFATDAGHQLALDRLFHDQAYGPAGAALGRITANHGDNALLSGGLQKRFGAAPLALVQRTFQAAVQIAMSDTAHGLRRKMSHARHRRSRVTVGQLLQGNRSQNHSYLLDS
jgi:hypothetical protein